MHVYGMSHLADGSITYTRYGVVRNGSLFLRGCEKDAALAGISIGKNYAVVLKMPPSTIGYDGINTLRRRENQTIMPGNIPPSDTDIFSNDLVDRFCCCCVVVSPKIKNSCPLPEHNRLRIEYMNITIRRPSKNHGRGEQQRCYH